MSTHARELEVIDDASGPAPTSGPRQATARIEAEVRSEDAEGGPRWVVREGGGLVHARQAASCLLRPRVGDRVLFMVEGEDAYVLAILDRAEPSACAELSHEGDLRLRVSGQLELRGDQSVRVHSEDEVVVQARRGRVFIHECAAVIERMVNHVARSTFVAKVIETFSERITTSSQTSLRSVSELDQVEAGVLDHRGRDAVHLAGDKVLVNGGEIAKVEAGQIHLG